MGKLFSEKKENNEAAKRNRIAYLTMICSSFVSLFFCSKCSVIYPFNDWYDVNLIFTTGKCMMNGDLLYVELLDHKGPYVFLLFGIAYLISHTTFLGLFILEWVFFFLFLCIIRKTLKLYTDREYLFVYPVISFIIVTSSAFVHGASTEEFSFPIIAYAIYLSLKLTKTKDIKFYEAFLAGIFSGILFWSKFTLCGIYLAWALIVIFVYAFKKNVGRIFQTAGIYILGCIAASAPWFLYFAPHRAIPEFLDSYLFSNILIYNNDTTVRGLRKIPMILSVMETFYFKKGNLFLTFFVFAGLIGFMILPKKKVSFSEKIVCAFLFFVTNLGVFFRGQAHGYYGLLAAVFLGFFAISVSLIIEKFVKKDSFFLKPYPAIIAAILGVGLAFLISDNVYLLKFKKDDMPQFKFAKIINEYEDRTLLNYRFLDGGVYTILGTMPNVKEYCTVNLNFADVVDVQKTYLAEGKTHFVVTWYEFPVEVDKIIEAFPEVADNYSVVESEIFYIEGDYRTYTLWIRK